MKIPAQHPEKERIRYNEQPGRHIYGVQDGVRTDRIGLPKPVLPRLGRIGAGAVMF